MGIIPSRNLEDQRREKDGIVYFDRGTLTGKNGRQYDRFAIQTHFVEVGEDQAELVRRYVLPLAQDGDVLSFGAKVMAMCTRNVKTKEEVHPGFWAKKLAPFAGINETGVGMHEPYKLQLVIDICGLPRVLFAAFVSAVTRPFGVHGLFYKICGKGVAGIDGFYLNKTGDTMTGALNLPANTWNGIGNFTSERIDFVVGPPTYATVSTNKTSYAVDETVTFTMNSDGDLNTLWIYCPNGETPSRRHRSPS